VERTEIIRKERSSESGVGAPSVHGGASHHGSHSGALVPVGAVEEDRKTVIDQDVFQNGQLVEHDHFKRETEIINVAPRTEIVTAAPSQTVVIREANPPYSGALVPRPETRVTEIREYPRETFIEERGVLPISSNENGGDLRVGKLTDLVVGPTRRDERAIRNDIRAVEADRKAIRLEREAERQRRRAERLGEPEGLVYERETKLIGANPNPNVVETERIIESERRGVELGGPGGLKVERNRKGRLELVR
jgi:hypothetical protein